MPRQIDVQEAIRLQDYSHPDTLLYLDSLMWEPLIRILGSPRMMTSYAEPVGKHWRPGDKKPVLADEDPAVMQVIGRCAAYRVRGFEGRPNHLLSASHPDRCPWCEYPVEELLAACEWATWYSRYLIQEVAVWEGKVGSYHRTVATAGYQNTRWKDWFASPVTEREATVAAIRAL